MDRMTSTEREAWLGGDDQIGERAVTGGFSCDSCDAPSSAISHQGPATPVVVECRACFLASLAAARLARA